MRARQSGRPREEDHVEGLGVEEPPPAGERALALGRGGAVPAAEAILPTAEEPCNERNMQKVRKR